MLYHNDNGADPALGARRPTPAIRGWAHMTALSFSRNRYMLKTKE